MPTKPTTYKCYVLYRYMTPVMNNFSINTKTNCFFVKKKQFIFRYTRSQDFYMMHFCVLSFSSCITYIKKHTQNHAMQTNVAIKQKTCRMFSSSLSTIYKYGMLPWHNIHGLYFTSCVPFIYYRIIWYVHSLIFAFCMLHFGCIRSGLN